MVVLIHDQEVQILRIRGPGQPPLFPDELASGDTSCRPTSVDLRVQMRSGLQCLPDERQHAWGESACVVGLHPPRDMFDEPRGILKRADH